MIKLNDRFSFDRYTYGWMLHETYIGTDKDGGDKEQVRVTYHGGLDDICGAVIDRSAGDCDSMKELRILLKDAESVLTGHVKKMPVVRELFEDDG